MTQSNTEQEPQYTEAEVRAAESAEQALLTASQSKYLMSRVVILRARLNRLEKENSDLRLEVHRLQAVEQEQSPEIPEG